MTFDLAGARQDNVQDPNETFTYDPLNRLKTNLLVKTSDSSQLNSTSYGYDIIGNMTYKSDLSHGGILTYDPARPHAVASAKGGAYTYDLNGNLTGGGGRRSPGPALTSQPPLMPLPHCRQPPLSMDPTGRVSVRPLLKQVPRQK